MMQFDELVTISGKPLTYPVTFRVPIPQYFELQQIAEQQGITISALLLIWLTEKLSECRIEVSRANAND